MFVVSFPSFTVIIPLRRRRFTSIGSKRHDMYIIALRSIHNEIRLETYSTTAVRPVRVSDKQDPRDEVHITDGEKLWTI